MNIDPVLMEAFIRGYRYSLIAVRDAIQSSDWGEMDRDSAFLMLLKLWMPLNITRLSEDN